MRRHTTPRSVLQRLAGRRPPRRPGGDEGIALITVIGTMGVVTALALVTLALVLGATPRARGSQDSSTALAAAQAGIDEYISRLNANDSYWTNANADATNAALTTPAGFAAAAGRALPGSSSTATTYKYTVLNSAADIASSGLIQLKVAGTSTAPGGTKATRTLIATLKIKGFLNYIYFSDVEAQDPALWSATATATYNGSSYFSTGGVYYSFRPNAAEVARDCATKYWEGRNSSSYVIGGAANVDNTATAVSTVTGASYKVPGPVENGKSITSGTLAGYCGRDIQFTSGDVIKGPLHSNDLLKLGGNPLFGDSDTTVYAGPSGTSTSALYWGGGSPSAGTAAQPGYPITWAQNSTDMPTGNTELLRYVEPKIDNDPNQDRKGCLYRGATKITFVGAKMKVLSPNTTDPNTPTRCYDYRNPGTEQTVDVPPVVYVAAATGTCTGVGYPMAGESTDGLTTNYTPCRGTAFVSGTLDSQTTVAGADDIVVTGNTTYADGGAGTDVLGLVATGFIWVYHPVDAWGNNLLPASSAVTQVQAGILSLKHSFLVQNYAQGAPISTGTAATKLNIFGAIAQEFRGPVGTGNGTTAATGYLKNYVYDTRFAALQPPYFIKPVKSPWGVQSVTDAPAGS